MLDAYRTPGRLQARILLHERFGDRRFDMHEWIFDLLLGASSPVTLPERAQVLEVGAGTGRMWQVVAGRVPSAWQITLTDKSVGMQDALREMLGRQGLHATVQAADVMTLPFAAASFDLVFANHMLYHVPEPAVGISELRRVLRPGGLLVAATNGAGHMAQVTRLVREVAGLSGVTVMGAEPLSFTCESGAAQLARHFANVQLHPHDDQLLVTDHEALLAYLRSLLHVTDDAPAATEAGLHRWERRVRSVPLPFAVDRATGVFLASGVAS